MAQYTMAYCNCQPLLKRSLSHRGVINHSKPPTNALKPLFQPKLTQKVTHLETRVRHEHDPTIGVMDVAWSENRPFTVSKLVEAKSEERIGGTLEVTVLGCLFLLAMHWTL